MTDTHPQPMPVGKGESVIARVIEDIKQREQMGIKTYGTTLKTHNGRRALVDAYQEALDLAIYLKQELMERRDREDDLK